MSEVPEISVVLVDFQYLTRRAIAALIDEIPGFTLTGEMEAFEEFIQEREKLNPRLLILEFQDKNPHYFQHIESILTVPDINILVIVNALEYTSIQALLKGGIIGIVSKKCSEGEIINAIKSVAKGRRFYCNSILDIVMEKDHPPKETHRTNLLTPRELEVLTLIVEGNTTQKIAKELHISVHTVNSHRKNILKKLNISTPTYLVAFAVSTGLVNIDHKTKKDQS